LGHTRRRDELVSQFVMGNENGQNNPPPSSTPREGVGVGEGEGEGE